MCAAGRFLVEGVVPLKEILTSSLQLPVDGLESVIRRAGATPLWLDTMLASGWADRVRDDDHCVAPQKGIQT